MPKGKKTSGVKSRGGYAELKHNWEKDIRITKFPDKTLVKIRFVGPVFVMARHWIVTSSGKRYPQWCTKFNSDTEELESSWKCAACDDFNFRGARYLIGNCINRTLQRKGDDNPIETFILPVSIQQDLDNIAEIIEAEIEDPDNGCDIAIKYDSGAAGNKKWSIQRGKECSLTEEEEDYELYELEDILPEFSDESIRKSWADQVRSVLVTNKYYVEQVNDDIAPEDPWSSFAIKPDGDKWTEFEELVLFEQLKNKQQQKGGTPQTGKGAKKSSSKKERPDYKNMKRKNDFDDLGLDDEDDAPAPPRKKAKAKTTKQAKPTGKKKYTKPKCYGEYDGSVKCLKKCPKPVMKRCKVTTMDSEI